MLSIGWVEMLVVASFALIVVGPRDLPAMLRQIGKVAGTARRMSNEFRSELNKVTALDEVRDMQKSIKEPFTDIKSGLESEFNKMSASGTVEPTGALKANADASESVVDDIRAKAGLARDGMNKAAVAKRDAEAAAALESPTEPDVATKTTRKPRAAAKSKAAGKPKAATKAKPATAAKTTTRKTAAKKVPAAAAKAPRKPRAKATVAAKTPAKSAAPKAAAKTTSTDEA